MFNKKNLEFLEKLKKEIGDFLVVKSHGSYCVVSIYDDNKVDYYLRDISSLFKDVDMTSFTYYHYKNGERISFSFPWVFMLDIKERDSRLSRVESSYLFTYLKYYGVETFRNYFREVLDVNFWVHFDFDADSINFDINAVSFKYRINDYLVLLKKNFDDIFLEKKENQLFILDLMFLAILKKVDKCREKFVCDCHLGISELKFVLKYFERYGVNLKSLNEEEKKKVKDNFFVYLKVLS